MNQTQQLHRDFDTRAKPGTVAVIGAGMAGLSAARVLSEAGAEVTVFDKSRGTGGRLASRSFEQGWIDLGAPYLSMDGSDLASFITERTSPDIIQEWNPDTDGVFSPDERISHVGVPRNSAVTRSLLADLNFQASTRITRMEPSSAGWALFGEDSSLLGLWNQVVLAVPVPQARDLLAGHPKFHKSLRAVSMEPCWVAAIETAEDLDGLADVTNYRHPVIRRISRNRAKPGRGQRNIYLIQANKHWSREYLEVEPQAVGAHLMESFSSLVSMDVKLRLLFAHLWRYAFVENPLGVPFLWDEHLKLGVCGDWCLGRRVEDAWRSGFELGQRMAARETSQEAPAVQTPRSAKREGRRWSNFRWFSTRCRH